MHGDCTEVCMLSAGLVPASCLPAVPANSSQSGVATAKQVNKSTNRPLGLIPFSSAFLYSSLYVILRLPRPLSSLSVVLPRCQSRRLKSGRRLCCAPERPVPLWRRSGRLRRARLMFTTPFWPLWAALGDLVFGAAVLRSGPPRNDRTHRVVEGREVTRKRREESKKARKRVRNRSPGG